MERKRSNLETSDGRPFEVVQNSVPFWLPYSFLPCRYATSLPVSLQVPVVELSPPTSADLVQEPADAPVRMHVASTKERQRRWGEATSGTCGLHHMVAQTWSPPSRVVYPPAFLARKSVRSCISGWSFAEGPCFMSPVLLQSVFRAASRLWLHRRAADVAWLSILPFCIADCSSQARTLGDRTPCEKTVVQRCQE